MTTDLSILRELAIRFVGQPYIWGGDDPIKGYDCSGLVQELLASVGMDPEGDQTAQALYDYFKRVGSISQRGLGALCFYGSSTARITHVTMMLNDQLMIEAGGGGSKSTDAEKAAAMNAYVRVRSYKRRGDLVAVIMPPYA